MKVKIPLALQITRVSAKQMQRSDIVEQNACTKLYKRVSAMFELKLKSRQISYPPPSLNKVTNSIGVKHK